MNDFSFFTSSKNSDSTNRGPECPSIWSTWDFHDGYYRCNGSYSGYTYSLPRSAELQEDGKNEKDLGVTLTVIVPCSIGNEINDLFFFMFVSNTFVIIQISSIRESNHS